MRAAQRRLEVHRAGHVGFTVGGARQAGFGVAHDDDVGAGLVARQQVGAGDGHAVVDLHGQVEQLALVVLGPVRGRVGQAGVGQGAGGDVGGRGADREVVELGHVVFPEARVGDLVFEHEDAQAPRFDLPVDALHLALGAAHVEEQREQRGHHDEHDGDGHHQLDQRQPALGAACGEARVHESDPMRTSVVTVRRHRSLMHLEPVPPS
ncbi:hypothetical protein D9M69_576530 [compost metagenome]